MSVVVIHAHPDDEVFATGAATTRLAAQGHRIILRIATGGEAAQSGDPAHARAVRTAQLDRSRALLGITDWSYLTEPGHGGPHTVAA